MATELRDALRDSGRAAGLDVVGFARAEPFVQTRQILEERKAEGLHGGMQFTYRKPARSADPSGALPNASSLVVGARSYRRQPAASSADPAARVGAYVWENHYEQLRAGLQVMADLLKEHGHATRVLMDDNALVDREAAYRAGIGWYGKNSNLLIPGRGSWFVLGSVVTDAQLPADEPVADGCGACDRCITGCPTGAIVAPGVVDARRCLAWLVQAEGDFPEEFRTALGNRIYGCDDCQEVCPPNRREDREPLAVETPAAGALVSVLDLLTLDDDALMDRHGAWYIPRRDPDYLRRNALVVLGNSDAAHQPGVRDVLSTYLNHANPMLRRHAAWAAQQLDLAHLVPA